jgi:hypothetical protein
VRSASPDPLSQMACVMRQGLLNSVGVAGFDSISLRGINERGDAVGAGFVSGEGVSRLFWPSKGGLRILGGDSAATDINNRGTVVGYRLRESGVAATAWNKTGPISLSLDGDSAPFRLNSRDEVVGWNANQALYWNLQTRALVRFGRADELTLATDINDRGEIVGSISTDRQQDMVIWRVKR